MIIHILQNKHIGAAEKYVLEFMLDTLGYFYDWIPENEPSAESDFIICYLPPQEIKTGEMNILYLPKISDLEKLHPKNMGITEKEISGEIIPLIAVDENLRQKSAETGDMNFDILANIYYHLTRLEEADFNHPDDVDREAENALLYAYGRFKRPVVDILLNYFDDILHKRLSAAAPFVIKKSAYPQGQDFGAAITHDVDIIRAYHPLKKAVLSFLYRLKLSKSLSPQEMNSADEKIFGFDNIFDFYRKKGWRGTFFFIARYTEGRHFRYRLKNRKIRNVIERLESQGHEIAWHPSRYAFEHPRRYKRELIRLQKISGNAVSGMRHHYLRCLYPQIWLKAEELGLSYDTGLAYRRHSGFRAGTTRPFPAFAHTQNRELNIWEFPTAIFETTVDKETKKIRSLIETIKQNEGLLTLIWHTNNFYPEYNLFAIWQKIIEILKEHYIFITSLKGHLQWQQQRKNISIIKIIKSTNQTKIIFNIPENLDSFSLKIISSGKPVKVSSSHLPSLKEINDKVIITNDKQSNNIELDFHQL